NATFAYYNYKYFMATNSIWWDILRPILLLAQRYARRVHQDSRFTRLQWGLHTLDAPLPFIQSQYPLFGVATKKTKGSIIARQQTDQKLPTSLMVGPGYTIHIRNSPRLWADDYMTLQKFGRPSESDA